MAMIYQENKSGAMGGFFSNAMQRRIDLMQERAGELFALGWLRKRLWKELAQNVKSVPATEFADYGKVLKGSQERCFALRYLSACHSALDDVKRIIDNAYDTITPQRELLQERNELVCEFATNPLARTWDRVMNDDKSWRAFANRMPFDDSNSLTAIDRFFYLIDRLSIITDILNGKGREYGLDIKGLPTESTNKKQQQLTNEVLAMAIERCSHHIVSQSAWAVVFCVLRDYYEYTNMSQFERHITSLPFTKQMKECPEGTVSKTLSNNDYMNESIIQWPRDKKFYTVATDIRKAIRDCMAADVSK